MALIPKISLCLKSGCKDLIFSETTGVYNNPSNLGGYGVPNPTLADINSAILTVTDPNDVIYTIDLYATGIFPKSNDLYEYTIPLADIGNPTNIIDGTWTFTYTLIDISNNTYIASKTYYFTCNVECCINALLVDIDYSECDCEDDKTNKLKIDNYNKSKAILDSIKYAIACNNTSVLENLMAIANKLCNKNFNCKTCN
jgi:hypothetical protein